MPPGKSLRTDSLEEAQTSWFAVIFCSVPFHMWLRGLQPCWGSWLGLCTAGEKAHTILFFKSFVSLYTSWWPHGWKRTAEELSKRKMEINRFAPNWTIDIWLFLEFSKRQELKWHSSILEEGPQASFLKDFWERETILDYFFWISACFRPNGGRFSGFWRYLRLPGFHFTGAVLLNSPAGLLHGMWPMQSLRGPH